MATKQVRKTKPKPTRAAETSTKTHAKVQGKQSAEAPDTKTKATPKGRQAAANPSKSSGSTRGKQAQAPAAKAKTTRRTAAEPDTRTRPASRKSSETPKGHSRQPASNGHVARRTKSAGRSKRRDEVVAGTSTAAPQPKAARSPDAERLFLNLFEALEAHAKARAIGHVTKDTRFDWGDIGEQELHPDLAFVSFDRWAAYRHVPKELTWHVVPDLVVEIIRGSEQTEPISAWLEQYFQAGVNRVWVIYPDQLKVHDHESLESSRVLGRDQVLDGGAILPDFQLPLKELLRERM